MRNSLEPNEPTGEEVSPVIGSTSYAFVKFCCEYVEKCDAQVVAVVRDQASTSVFLPSSFRSFCRVSCAV